MSFVHRQGRLKDFALINANSLSANTEVDYLIRYIEISNVDSNGVISEAAIETLRFEDAPSRARRCVGRKNTIISSVRPNLQAMAYFEKADDNLICSTGFNVVAPRFNYVSGRFLYYVLRSDASLQYFVATAKGVGYPAVDEKDFNTLDVVFPQLGEQIRIAQYLDRTCVAVDRAITVKQQQLEKLNLLGNSIISRVVLEGLESNADMQSVKSSWFKKIPGGWNLRRLKDAVSIQTGITLGKDYEGELVERPYLRVANVQDGYLDLDEVKTILLPECDVARYLLQPNDVLMTEGGDLDKLGRGHVWRGEVADCLHQNHVFAIRCDEKMLLPEYLAYLTSSKHGRNYFEITGKRTTNLASTNSTKVGQFPVPLPPVREQREIISFLENELGKIEKVMKGVRKQVDVLSDYKKSLIHECVTGKRRITEADLKKVA